MMESKCRDRNTEILHEHHNIVRPPGPEARTELYCTRCGWLRPCVRIELTLSADEIDPNGEAAQEAGRTSGELLEAFRRSYEDAIADLLTGIDPIMVVQDGHSEDEPVVSCNCGSNDERCEHERSVQEILAQEEPWMGSQDAAAAGQTKPETDQRAGKNVDGKLNSGSFRLNHNEIVEWTGNAEDRLSGEDMNLAGMIYSPGNVRLRMDSQKYTARRLLKWMLVQKIPRGSSRKLLGGPSHMKTIKDALIQAGNEKNPMRFSAPVRGFRITDAARELSPSAWKAHDEHQQVSRNTSDTRTRDQLHRAADEKYAEARRDVLEKHGLRPGGVETE